MQKIEKLVERVLEKMLAGDTTSAVSDAPEADFGSTHKIVVCQRGFVYAGDVTKVGDYLVIDNAVNLRQWGTTKGLGELALNGNTDSTVSDAVGTVRVHELAVVSLLDCKKRLVATT